MKRALGALICVVITTATAHGQLKVNAIKLRDVGLENQVSKLLEQARKNGGPKRLSRITYRSELQSLVCTATLTNKVPVHATGVPVLASTPNWHPASALYKTSEPGKLNDELKRLAAYDGSGQQGYRRFSVAVWRVPEAASSPQFWVAVEFYGNAAVEFFDDHFTDDIWYHNQWKDFVVPECQ